MEELVNPLILLFDQVFLSSYAVLMGPGDSTHCFTVNVLFVWEFKMWIEPCRFTAGICLDLCLVCVCVELYVGMCVWVVPATTSVCNNRHIQLLLCLQGTRNTELRAFNEFFVVKAQVCISHFFLWLNFFDHSFLFLSQFLQSCPISKEIFFLRAWKGSMT